MKLGDCHHLIVFGGSFDPPHLAHVKLPMRVRERIGAEAVLYVPAGRAPHKLDRVQTDAHHRLAMLRLALRDATAVLIETAEIDRAVDGAPTYTIDTLDHVRRRATPGARLRLLIGADQVRIFDSWKAPERVVEMGDPLVMLRAPDTRESVLAALPDEQTRAIWRSRFVDVPAMDISATEIRRRVAEGEPISALVEPQVETYIRAHGLYGSEE